MTAEKISVTIGGKEILRDVSYEFISGRRTTIIGLDDATIIKICAESDGKIYRKSWRFFRRSVTRHKIQSYVKADTFTSAAGNEIIFPTKVLK